MLGGDGARTLWGMEAPVLFALWLAMVAFWLVSLIDAGRWSARQWGRINRPKGVWMAGLFFTGIVGGFYYWTVLRRLLKKANGTKRPPQTLSGEL